VTAGGSAFAATSATLTPPANGGTGHDSRRPGQRLTTASTAQQEVQTSLLTLTGAGWCCSSTAAGPTIRTTRPILVGPAGVLVVEERGRRARPGHRDLAAPRRLVDQIEDALAADEVAPAAITPVRVVPGAGMSAHAGEDGPLRVPTGSLVPTLLGLPHRLPPEMVDALAGRLERELHSYERDGLHLVDFSDVDTEPDWLDPDELADAQSRGLARPIETWMTFLHPDQISIIRRQFGGPSRISRAPGTVMPVVGLLRAAYLARGGTGTVLFVSGAATLAQVQATLFGRLAPTLVDRAEFTEVHAWALRLLRQRGYSPRLDGADDCFDAAWEAVGRGTPLEQVEPDHGYWKDEIGYVIKGRGAVDLASYLDLPRPGRRVPLQKAHRLAVWDLYVEYERLKKEREVQDHADLLSDALAGARRQSSAYAAVIADEVRPHPDRGSGCCTLVGDAPNGLLLIGDGQQSVYRWDSTWPRPGSPSAAPGRRRCRNYRNGDAIAQTAMVAAADPYDDIDGPPSTAAVGQSTVQEGRVVSVVTRTKRAGPGTVAHRVDLAEVNRMACRRRSLCARRRTWTGTRGCSRRRMPIEDLDRYDGRPTPAIKVGTIRRGKGLGSAPCCFPASTTPWTGPGSGFSRPDRVALANRQLYVGMTRARDLLWLGQVQRLNHRA
jgi:hypothetical protein